MSIRTTLRRSALALAAALAIISGCKHAPSDLDAIRAGITQHLASLKTLNISAMDVDINSVSIQGSHASVQVTFHPKTGGAQDAGMQVAYEMEKRDSDWVVVKTNAVGGGIQHPPANANPHQAGQADVHGSMPNFRELIPSTSSSPGGTLPPGHPPVDPAAQTKAPDPNAKPN